MRTLALAAVAALIVAGAGLATARSLGLGPFGRAAPASWLYVAVSRNDDETDAREIEVVDTATGERSLFDVGTRISTLAVSPDRRTLFVGALDGRVLLLDATSGAKYAELRARSTPAHVLALGGERLAVVSGVPNIAGLVAVFDLARKQELAAVQMPGPVGRPALSEGRLLVPVIDGGANDLYELTVDPLGVSAQRLITRITGRIAFGVPQAALRDRGEAAYLSQYDSSVAGARLFLDVRLPTNVVVGVQRPFDERPVRGLSEVLTSFASAPDGSLHVCVGNANLAARYRVFGFRPERVGDECGTFARAIDGSLALAVRGRPQLATIDAATGRLLRTFPLPGIPTQVTN